MDEHAAPRPSPLRAFDVDTVALLERVADADFDAVAQLVRERDSLLHLHEALTGVDGAASLEERLHVFVDAIRRIGFQRVVIALRDAMLNPTLLVSAGLDAEEERELREHHETGETWQRRFAAMERFRVSQSYYLDGRDPWVQAEFQGSITSALEMGDDPEWTPRDMLIVPLRGSDGTILATLVLDDPVDRRRPTLVRIRTVELFGQQVAHSIERARLFALAQRRAERLQRLQEVGAMLARSLDERQVVRELARQVVRIVPSDGVVVAHPDLERGRVTTALRIVRGVEIPRAESAIGADVVAEVARTGRPVRIGEATPEAIGDDWFGADVRGGSVLAVPMLVGIRLVGVVLLHAAARDAYGPEDEEVLLTIGAQAGTALANARLYADAQREQRQSEALADIARAVSESLRFGEVLQLILRHAVALLRAEGATLSLRRDDYLHIVAGIGCGEVLSGMHLPIDGSISGHVVREGTWAIVNDLSGDTAAYRPTQRMAGVTSTVAVPLLTGQGPIGVLSVVNRPTGFTDDDARVLQRLADHVAVAIVNARLFEEVNEATREWTVAFDAVSTGMAVIDETGRVRRCNQRAMQLLAVARPADATGMDFVELLLGTADAPAARDALRPAVEEGTAVRVTVRSATRLFDLAASPHPIGGAVVTFDDVTPQHALAERYRRVLETVSDAIVITDLERRIAFTNPAASALFGTDDLVGRPIREFIAAEHRDALRGHEDRALAGEPQRYEAALQRTDGEQRLVSVSVAPLREVGELTGLVASLRDVTDERRARDAVARSEARYRNLFENATDAIYTIDAAGRFTSANAATGALIGVAPESLLGGSLTPYLVAEEMDRVREAFGSALAGEASHYECSMLRVDGARRLLSVTNTPIRLGREIAGVLGIARDVTEEHARARALAHSEARYTRLIESAPDGIFTLAADRRCTAANRALERATGLPREALVGRAILELVDERDREVAAQAIDLAMAGQTHRVELRYHDAHGEERWTSLLASPMPDAGEGVGMLGVARDVTDEKRLTEQLVQQEKLAAIGQLVSGVAHELNNPLAGVMAFSQLLLSGDGLPEDHRHSVETIHQEAKRAAKIVANLLTFARQHPPSRVATDLNQVLTDTLELRRYALRLADIEVDVQLDAALPLTWADPFQLQQVLLNLIGNAEQALLDWRGERRLLLATARRGATLVVSVSDSAGGIPSHVVDQIFNPFFTTKPVGKGTGLGLSISDGIVREHGGRIRVESRAGVGAAFHVELPITRPPAAPPLDHGAPGYATDTSPGAPRTVLIVDDEASLRGALTSYLAAEGHRPEAVGTLRDAGDRLDGRRYDILLLDVRLPDGNGVTFFEALRERDAEQASRVVFMTGDVHGADAGGALSATSRPCLYKPFTFDELATVCFGTPAA